MDDMGNIRGNKEIVNGHVVDEKGMHLDKNALINLVTKVNEKVAAGEEVTKESIKEVAEEISGDSLEEADGFRVDEKGVHFDKDSLVSSLTGLSSMASLPKMTVKASGKQKKTAQVDYGIYQPIWEEIQKIPLTADSCEEDIKILANAIKVASRDIKIRKIVSNTQAIAKNAQNFYYTESGMRTVFSILGNKFSMIVKGELTGTEAFYIQVNGDTLEGIVLQKDASGDFSDATKNYQIHIKREQ